jgi:hypothetical protein
MDRAVTEVEVMLTSEILLNLPIARKTVRAVQAGLELRADLGRDRAGFAGGVLDGQQCGQASLFVETEPGADRMAMHGHQLRQSEPGPRLAAGEQIERL